MGVHGNYSQGSSHGTAREREGERGKNDDLPHWRSPPGSTVGGRASDRRFIVDGDNCHGAEREGERGEDQELLHGGHLGLSAKEMSGGFDNKIIQQQMFGTIIRQSCRYRL